MSENHIENAEATEVVKEDKKEKKEETTEVAEEKKYSDKDVDSIVSKKFAKWQKEHENKLSEAQKLAEMNAQQKAEYERDKLVQELEALKKEQSYHEMSKTASSMLIEAGVKTVDDSLLKTLVREDAESTSESVTSFINLFKKAVEEGVSEKLKQPAPKRSYKGKGLTKEDILKEKDSVKRQTLIRENLELFN